MDDEQYFELERQLQKVTKEAHLHAKSVVLAMMGMTHSSPGTTIDQVQRQAAVSWETSLDAAINAVFKAFEELGVGRFHKTTRKGISDGYFEWFGDANEICRAAWGVPHLMDIIPPGEEVPSEGPARDRHVATRLRRLYQNRGGNERLVLTALAVRDHMKDGTSTEEISDTCDVSQHLVRDLFEDLEALGVGRYVRNETGKPAYMEWHASSQEVGKAACGKPHHLMITGPGFDLDRANALRRHASMVANELGVSEDQVVISIRM